ncbi:sulfur carrier protein ThiS [Endozoicomonas sp. Mp262]|uniref:sulfur carrier protein ThiS n=1 Tax=Endozoicomonas sp. Mp262 TaxID=2919499 RepID=UPI0021DB1954
MNDKPMALDNPVTLETLLEKLNQHKTGIALAVNKQIIARSQWISHKVCDGDQITVITATAGG